jgi:hypothetical protein
MANILLWNKDKTEELKLETKEFIRNNFWK